MEVNDSFRSDFRKPEPESLATNFTNSFSSISTESDPLGYALSLIQKTFSQRSQRLREQINELNNSVTAKENRICEMRKKVENLELENLDAKQQNLRMIDDNRNLCCSMKKLKTENFELSKIKENILSTLGPQSMPLPPCAPRCAPSYTSPCAPPCPPMRQMRPASGMQNYPIATPRQKKKESVGVVSNTPSNKQDGRLFFITVKERLSPPQFGEFLSLIKKSNSREISKEMTIENARAIFGEENEDLVSTFIQIL